MPETHGVPEPRAISGIGVSAGVVAGPAAWMSQASALPAPRVVTDPVGELEAARGALKMLAADLGDRAQRAGGAARDILDALTMIAGDPTLDAAVEAKIAVGADAAHALAAAFDDQAAVLREGGGYLAERAADLEDLRDRAVAALLGLPMPGVPDPGFPFVLVADDLAPADTATLDPANVLALVTVRGGPTSHTAILARSLGIPAVVGVVEAGGIRDGDLIAVDGGSGAIRIGVDVAEYGASTQRASTQGVALSKGQTSDGHPVPLLLNIGGVKDIRTDAEGVGLLRTEFLFLGRHDAPSVEEQRAAYAAVFDRFPGKRVVIRTLDAGADKPLPFLGLPPEENPALGVRGLRTSRLLPQILDDQLTAIAEAARQTSADVWVMAPMVATATEAASFAAQARARGLTTVGVMIEIPAAALRAHQILEHVDFLSIGTNDLSQYVMAADRQDGRLADLLDPWQPALLDLVAACAAAGRAAGKPVGVCGEAAADPQLAAVLVGLGVTSLSMSAWAIPGVHAALGGVSKDDCEDAAARARA